MRSSAGLHEHKKSTPGKGMPNFQGPPHEHACAPLGSRMMQARRMVILTCVLVAVTALTSVRLQSQSPAPAAGIQAALAGDAGHLSDKFSGLAGVMVGKYDWKPGEGVRSVSDVFNLIVMENNMLTGILTNSPAQPGARPEPITDPAKMQEALRTSYANLQKAINALPDSDLKTPVKLFGMDLTKQAALMLLLSDQHEHLGQSIAYARINGVVPPWSK
jgi:uncharacterized damage-inducible protein DinB